MRSYLSGMPELKLGLNDKLLFEATVVFGWKILAFVAIRRSTH